MPFLFCNICWMSEYKGHRRVFQPDDQPQRGGRWVTENGTAHECCNFLPDKNGIVYGHVETWKGNENGYDTKIKIEKLGANIDDEYIDGISVIWIATHENGGRRVVGWYKNARVYRVRQHHENFPTHQHKRDKLDSYRVVTSEENATLIPENLRSLRLGSGPGWPGHNQLFYPEEYSDNQELILFLMELNNHINTVIPPTPVSNILRFSPESYGESTLYIDNIRQMRRIHGKIVNALHARLSEKYGIEKVWNNQFIDIAISDDGELKKLFEVKTGNDTQSIYTGIGQLTFHSNGNRRIKKFLVLPQSANGYQSLYELFDAIDIWISEYSINDDGEISFMYLPD